MVFRILNSRTQRQRRTNREKHSTSENAATRIVFVRLSGTTKAHLSFSSWVAFLIHSVVSHAVLVMVFDVDCCWCRSCRCCHCCGSVVVWLQTTWPQHSSTSINNQEKRKKLALKPWGFWGVSPSPPQENKIKHCCCCCCSSSSSSSTISSSNSSSRNRLFYPLEERCFAGSFSKSHIQVLGSHSFAFTPKEGVCTWEFYIYRVLPSHKLSLPKEGVFTWEFYIYRVLPSRKLSLPKERGFAKANRGGSESALSERNPKANVSRLSPVFSRATLRLYI